MFDTPTTAFYHGPSQHNKGLLSNIPSAFPSQIFSSPFSLGGYFQQSSQQPPSQQEAKLSSPEPSSNATVTSEPTAPQQPTHTNRRTQRRAKQQPQNSISSSIAAAAQRVVVANSNMGNVNTAMAQPSNFIASTSNAASSSHHHHHATNRRKKSSNKINRKKVDDAITLSAFAVEQDNQGNHDVAMDFYLTAVENMLEALPIHSNQSRRDALKNKLKEFMDRTGLSDELMGSTNASSSARTNEPEEPPSSKNGPKMSHQIIQAAINSAVALKQSPIPDAISATVNYTMKKFQKIDEAYGLQEKAWEVSRSGMELALEIDQQYNIHEKVSNAFFVGLAAAMRATIAYKDAPSYSQLQKMTDVSPSHNCKEVATEC